jgi:hypothetical protein
MAQMSTNFIDDKNNLPILNTQVGRFIVGWQTHQGL